MITEGNTTTSVVGDNFSTSMTQNDFIVYLKQFLFIRT